jgi:N-acetylglutamate synthase-like GNAT family acetyltransferase
VTLSKPAISVRAAGSTEFDDVVALLSSAGMPTRDLSSGSIDAFLVAADEQEVLGAVALERYGEVGLLRSLVVAPDHRGSGLGAALVQAIEQRARDEGVTSLVLLTETAEQFFRALGYTAGRRANAPAAVRASSEFAFVCPASAVYMEKSLR